MSTCRNHVRARYLLVCLVTGTGIFTIPSGADELAADPSHIRELSPPLASAGLQPVRSAHALDKLPISFEKNRGQTDSLVRFISRAPNYTLFLTPTEAVLALQNGGGPAATATGRSRQPPTRSALRMTLSGANPDSEIVGLDELPGKVNYARLDPAGRLHQANENIPTYSRVRYRGIYPGIDLVYYGKEQSLEYDFILAPGVSPDPIRLAFSGADALDVDQSGTLVVATPAGTLRLEKPVIYQDVDGRREPVAGGYLVDGNTVSFSVGEYDRQRALVIDPVLLYSSFLGGTGGDEGGDVAVDADGNIYLTGSTASVNFPSVNAVQSANAGNWDAFVTKLNPAGTTVLYSTYFGDGGNDTGRGIFVDTDGNAYVAGSYAVLSALGLWRWQVLVAKFAATGAFVGGTVFGAASGEDIGYAIAVDPLGYVYVTGQTAAGSDFPTTPNAFQPEWGGFHDAFLSVLTPDGTGLVYSTYLGSGMEDEGRGIALDSLGYVYVTGGTMGGFPTTAGAYQREGTGAAFVVKINPWVSGAASLVYSTLLDGTEDTGFESGAAIAVDSAGNAYVTGSTDSALDFPVTPNAYQREAKGVWDCGTSPPRDCTDAFFTKLNATGSDLLYSTHLGGLGNDHGYGIAVDGAGSAYVVGDTFAFDFPVRNAVQAVKAGGNDAFVTKFDPSGGVVYSTYLGGAADDTAIDIALDSAGNAYVVGKTASANFPVVAPYQSTYRGNTDAFLLKIGDTGCTFSISPTTKSFTSSAGTGSITVTASTSTCAWSSTSNVPWVTITSGSGTGSGTATYSVAANTSTSLRSGTLTVARQTFTVNQAGATCTYSISPTNQSFGASGGTGSISVTASAASCGWNTTNTLSWVTITSGSGTGTGNAAYSVAANAGATSRSGTFTVAGQTFTVNQAGASAAASVTVAAPNGGEKLYTGTAYRIDWNAAGSITRFDVEASTNGGATYAAVPGCSALAGAARSCTWAAPGPVTSSALIRVMARDAGGATIVDVSNGAFSILSGSASVTVTFPNTAVNVGIGSLQQVKWTHNLGSNAFVRIELSRDGGVTYPELLAAAVKNTAATSGTFAWRVSGPVTTGAQARLRLTWTNGAAGDVGNVNFTIAPPFIKVTLPATNSSWGFATKQKQAWTTNLGALDFVNVQLSTTGATGSFTTMPGGANIVATKKSATVTVPSSPTATARTKVMWANPPAGVTVQALNPGNFKLEAPFVNVTAPGAGHIWPIGSLATIAWTNNLGALENVKIELSKDGGTSYSTVVLSSTPSDGIQKVTILSGWGTQSTTRIRVSWLKSPSVLGQSATFTIQP